MPRCDWLKLTPGTQVRVEHGEGWAYPEGILVAYVAPTGWASVDLGTLKDDQWLGVRHVPYASISKIFRG